jgi:hypothetical protein
MEAKQMTDNICVKHKLPLKWRKDRNGKFCVKCTDPKAQGNGLGKYNKGRG